MQPRRRLVAVVPRGLRERARWALHRPTPQMVPRNGSSPRWDALPVDRPETEHSVRSSRFLADYLAHALRFAPAPIHLLDAGCGMGRLRTRLAEAGLLDRVAYTGLEYGDLVADAARAATGAAVVEGSIENMPFEDGSFDVAVAQNVIETLETYEDAVRELLRVSAWLVVVALKGSADGRERRGHAFLPGVGHFRITHWSGARIKQFARENGAALAFTVNSLSEDDGVVSNVHAFYRTVEAVPAPRPAGSGTSEVILTPPGWGPVREAESAVI